MPHHDFTRRGFLRTLAVASPAALGLAALQGKPAASTTAVPQPLPEGDYAAFPLVNVAPATGTERRKSEASLVSLNDGGVLMAYAAHAGGGDNARAPLVAINLDAGGRPAGGERIIVPPPEGGFNAMSPALQRLPDGRIGMLFSYRQSQDTASRRFTFSSDEGRTWSPHVIVADGHYKTGCHDRFTIHSSGRLLAPCHCTEDRNSRYLHVRVSRSDDAGATWILGEPIQLPRVVWPDGTGGRTAESGCIEPGIAERADGSLIMTLRTAMGTQFKSESSDRGSTWSPPCSMEVTSPVAPAHISRLPDNDDLLLLWTSDFDAKAPGMGERHTIMACVSRDGGNSWPHVSRKVLIHFPGQSVDYPSVLYRGDEAWITLRVSTGKKVLQGSTSTHLIRVPLDWFRA